MAAGLEGNVSSRTIGTDPRLAQGVDLGVGLARPHVPALADDRSVADDDAADPGVGGGGVEAAHRETQGAGHEAMIRRMPHDGQRDRRRRTGFSTSSIASLKSSTS